jgi:hypothetical protein
MHSVIQTPAFLSDAKYAGMSEDEQEQIVDYMSTHPTAGDVIKGTNGARKIRFAGRGKGKSGGYRVITFYGGDDIPIFLLNIFSKGDRVDLSQADRNKMRQGLAFLANEYRQGVARYVESR